MVTKPVIVSCPQCSKEVVWSSDNKYRPFCSERCKMIDLGQWAKEEYRVPDSGPIDQLDEFAGHA